MTSSALPAFRVIATRTVTYSITLPAECIEDALQQAAQEFDCAFEPSYPLQTEYGSRRIGRWNLIEPCPTFIGCIRMSTTEGGAS